MNYTPHMTTLLYLKWRTRRRFRQRRLQRQGSNGLAEMSLAFDFRFGQGQHDSSNAALSAQPLQPGATVKSFGDYRLATAPEAWFP
jgi:hypothetical protein